MFTCLIFLIRLHVQYYVESSAFFQAGKPVYSAKFVRFRVGYPKNANEIEVDASQKSADDKFLWSYTSPLFPMMQVKVFHVFDF